MKGEGGITGMREFEPVPAIGGRDGQAPSGQGVVEKLVEHRRAHYASHSEAAQYLTNTPATVKLRFSSPLFCRLTAGFKAMRVGDSDVFGFEQGDAMYVPPNTEILVDLGAADADAPITCDVIEIESGRVDAILARLNDRLAATGANLSARIDWSRFAVLRGRDADELRLARLMELFRADDPLFRDLRIENRIEDALMTLLQHRSRDLLEMDEAQRVDSGVMAAVRLIRADLARHVPNEELARAACMSESSLLRHFRRQFGMTPARYTNQCRITEARRLLTEDQGSTEAIAFRLGFSSTSHFARVFRQITGEAPAEYRARRRVGSQAAICGSRIRD